MAPDSSTLEAIELILDGPNGVEILGKLLSVVIAELFLQVGRILQDQTGHIAKAVNLGRAEQAVVHLSWIANRRCNVTGSVPGDVVEVDHVVGGPGIVEIREHDQPGDVRVDGTDDSGEVKGQFLPLIDHGVGHLDLAGGSGALLELDPHVGGEIHRDDFVALRPFWIGA